MKKKILMFLLSLFFIVPSVFLVACGNNDNNGGQSVTVERVEVTPKSGTHFTYEYGCFYLDAGYNPEVEITKDAFTVTIHYSDGSKVEDFKDYTLSVMANENGNYTAKVKYENYYLSDYTVIVNDEVLDAFVGVTQEQDAQGDKYGLYTNNEIVYKGSAYNILDEIKTTNNVSISTLIQQGKVYLNAEYPGDTTATDANQQNDDYIYYYNFLLYASNGYVWQIDGQTISVMSIKWRILPQEIAITAPTMTTEGALEYNGANQVPAFSFDVNTEQYFDMQVENNQHKDSGEYTYVINLKNEYSTSNNYRFTISDSTNVHQNTEYVGCVQLEASWNISPKQLDINASDIAIINNDGTKQYEGADIIYPRFVYDPNGITIETNVDSLTDVFDIDGYIENVGGDCIYYYGITLQEGAAGNYVYANGDTVTEGVGLSYYVAEAQGSLPIGMPANIILNSTIFNNYSLCSYSFTTDMIDTSEGKTVISQEVLDALDAATSLYWKDDDQVLYAGTNEVVVLYKVLNYTAVEFTVTWPVDKAKLELTLTWCTANNGSSMNYRTEGYREAYLDVSGVSSNLVGVTYNTTYKGYNDAEYGIPTATRTDGESLYLIDAGLYKTTATLSCNENYYLTYAGYENPQKLSVGENSCDWEIMRVELSSSFQYKLPNNTKIQRYYDGNENICSGYYLNTDVDIDYYDGIIATITNDDNIIEINNEKYNVNYEFYNESNQTWEATETFSTSGLYRVVFTFNLNKNYYIDAETINVVYMEFKVYDLEYTLSNITFENSGTYTYTGDLKTSTPRIESIEGLQITYTYYDSNNQVITDVTNASWEAGTYKVSAEITPIATDMMSEPFPGASNVTINGVTSYQVSEVSFTIVKKQLNKSDFEINVSQFTNGYNKYYTRWNSDSDFYFLMGTKTETNISDLLGVLDRIVVVTDANDQVVTPTNDGTLLEPNTLYHITVTVSLYSNYQNCYELLNTTNGEWVYTIDVTTGAMRIEANDVFEWNFTDAVNKTFDHVPNDTSDVLFIGTLPASVANWTDVIEVTYITCIWTERIEGDGWVVGTTEIVEPGTSLISGSYYDVTAIFSVKEAYQDKYEILDYQQSKTHSWQAV